MTLSSAHASTAKQLYAFAAPGAGGTPDADSTALLELQRILLQGKTKLFLKALEEQPDQARRFFETCVEGTESGASLMLPLPLASLVMAKQPHKILATLQAAAKKGYQTAQSGRFQGAPVSWEGLCGATWLMLQHAKRELLYAQIARTAEAADRCVTPHRRATSLSDSLQQTQNRFSETLQQFVVFMGGDRARLQDEPVKADMLALAVRGDSASPLFIAALLGDFPHPERLWMRPDASGVTPARVLAEKLLAGALLKRQDRDAIVSSPQSAPKFYTPLTLMRYFRTAWDVTGKEESLQNDLALMRGQTHNSLEPEYTASTTVQRWHDYAPGFKVVAQCMDTLAPLHDMPPSPVPYFQRASELPSSQSKGMQGALRHFKKTWRAQLSHLPEYALHENNGNAVLQWLHTTPSRNVLVSSPMTEAQAMRSKKTHTPSASALLVLFAQWLDTAHSSSAQTRTFCKAVQAFERTHQAPFTFCIAGDTRRWTLHGYLWSRASDRAAHKARLLADAGYRVGGEGFYTPTPEGGYGPAEPIELCYLQRLGGRVGRVREAVTLVKRQVTFTTGHAQSQPLQAMRVVKERSPTLQEGVIAERIDATLKEIVACGWVPDWTRRDSRNASLTQCLIEEVRIKDVNLLLPWWKQHVGLQTVTLEVVQHLQARTQALHASWDNDREESVTLLHHLEQALFTTLSQETPVSPRGRPRL